MKKETDKMTARDRLSTVDYLSEDTPIENVQMLVDAGKKNGDY